LVSFALVVFGIAVYWPTGRQLGWLALYAIVFHMMVITEEEHLLNVYGEAYRRYCQQVPRYLGIPRREPHRKP
jgi:protein-S-isoprenylcysteine O-methyltransferase Ste14